MDLTKLTKEQIELAIEETLGVVPCLVSTQYAMTECNGTTYFVYFIFYAHNPGESTVYMYMDDEELKATF